jgi:hypothetical protein
LAGRNAGLFIGGFFKIPWCRQKCNEYGKEYNSSVRKSQVKILPGILLIAKFLKPDLLFAL